jgi:hypothetical protein
VEGRGLKPRGGVGDGGGEVGNSVDPAPGDGEDPGRASGSGLDPPPRWLWVADQSVNEIFCRFTVSPAERASRDGARRHGALPEEPDAVPLRWRSVEG